MLDALAKRLWQRRSADELREAGKRALEAGDAATAARLLEQAGRRKSNDAEAWICAGDAHYRLAAYRKALECFERCIAIVPSSAEAHFKGAAALHMLGDPAEARRYCDRALASEPQHVGTHHLLAKMDLPGASYTQVLAAIHRKLAPRTYVEIGIAAGDSLRAVLPSTSVVAIDPDPQLATPVAANVQVHPLPSDDYFATRDVRADLGGAVELAFIDGAHTFDQALRDFINIERHATRVSTVLLHDTYPLDRFTAQRERESPFWSGDVWKLVLILKKYRPDLTVANVGAPPTGLCVVRGLDPDSRILADRHDAIVGEFMPVDYSVLGTDKAGLLNRFPNDIARVLELVSSRRPEPLDVTRS